MPVDPRLAVRPRCFGIYGGRLVSGYLDYRPNAPAQPLHYGWDVAAEPGVYIRALGRCEVVRARDFDSVRGYHQEVTVWYESAMTYVLYGHVARGLPHRVGDVLGQGDVIASVGTTYDAMGTAPHAHIQVWKDRPSMEGYVNTAAIDPARVRRWYGGY